MTAVHQLSLGVIFPPDLPPEQLRDVAVAADDGGLDQLWLWEDCFAESGIASAAAVLGWTKRVAVGIGLLPVPLRNVALTAMELATLARLFPGRFVPGIGHGVQEWMDQVGVRAESPLTLLSEYAGALRGLLAGDTVSSDGRYVRLRDVTLNWPPASPPPLLIGGVRERTVRLAGRHGDGVILVGETTPDQVQAAAQQQAAGRIAAGRDGAGDVVMFLPVPATAPAQDIAARIAQFAAAGATCVALQAVEGGPPLAEFTTRVARDVRPLLDA